MKPNLILVQRSLLQVLERSGQDITENDKHGRSVAERVDLLLEENNGSLQDLADEIGMQWREEMPACGLPQFASRYPISLARQKAVMAFDDGNESQVSLAIGKCVGLEQVDIVGRLLGRPVVPFFASKQKIEAAINATYEQRNSQTVESIESLDSESALQSLVHPNREDLLDSSGRSPVVRLVNSILFDAVQERASDIHLQPFEDELHVRFRIDGVLFDQFKIPKSSQEEVLSRIKVIGEMNIAEKRLPQDGRASVKVGERMIDLRIASLPTSFGERIVIRLLDKSARLYTLEELGMPKGILATFRRLIHLEHGLVLVTGPTGGGKSTTLYAGLQEINTGKGNVVTLEDPIEYQLTGISQTQVSEKRGLTFADGLRSVLRQDPDIIMVGEIRDRETAEMAIQSALTGHLVFSTLHTNDAASAINRLLDLGIEPYLVASSLLGVLAQRLVRRVCQQCKQAYEGSRSTPALVDQWNSDVLQKYVGLGCEICRRTGFQGRVGLFELMVIDDKIRELVQSHSNASVIREMARQHGMKLLREDGIEKVKQGLTTLDEVVRVSMDEVV
ncbi:MAG: ATPase, T2SS/T4P/T4SS family [Planctomycetota bacterium]